MALVPMPVSDQSAPSTNSIPSATRSTDRDPSRHSTSPETSVTTTRCPAPLDSSASRSLSTGM